MLSQPEEETSEKESEKNQIIKYFAAEVLKTGTYSIHV